MRGQRTAPYQGLGTPQFPLVEPCLAELCCVNTECADEGKRDHDNLSVRT